MIRLYRMDCLNAIKLFVLLTFFHATSGQTLSVLGPSKAAAGTNVLITCTADGVTLDRLQWVEVNSGGGSSTIFNGDEPYSANLKYSNFEVTSLLTTESVMTIESADVEDDGAYKCQIPTYELATPINLVVEAESTKTLILDDTVTNNEDMYVATCDAIGGKPQETIKWFLNGDEQTHGTDGNTIVTKTTATPPLSTTNSVFTFPATLENYNQTLVCQVSGHDVLTELNGNKSIDLDIHASPSDAGTTVIVDYKPVTQGAGIVVSCNAEMQPDPAMRIYSIFSNGTSIHESMEAGNEATVSAPIEGTQYTCMAGNYLGNTPLSAAVTYDPKRPTTPSPTTEPITPEGNTPTPPGLPTTQPSMTTTNDTGTPTGDGPNVAAIAGGVVGGIVVIVIIVIAVLYCKKQERFCFEAGGTTASSNKPSGRAVGSSNGSGSEKDVESPLNGVKDVTAEEKLPQAAPRGHGSIQHTNDNPDQAMYAMVDKKKPSGGGGGDAPDTRGSGPGQNEPGSMLYADLDLSHKAGHTDKHVPKNENDVVVYSSILV